MVMNIKPIFLAALIAALVSVGSAAAAGTCKSAAGVETTCKAVAKANPSLDRYYDYCVGSLRSVSDAGSLDLQGLAGAAVRLALANAESAEAKVDDLMDLEFDPAAKAKYRDCYDAYDDATDHLKDALDAVNARLYNKAARLLRSMPAAYEKCRNVFEGATGVRSPVGEMDGEYERLAGIGLAIVSMVD